MKTKTPKQKESKSNTKNTSSTKPLTKRDSKKYPALDPSVNLKTRTDQIDYDYINKLSEKEKAWLNKFTNEWINDVVDRKNPRKNVYAKSRKKIKECDDRNNARNRCILTKQKASGGLKTLDDVRRVTKSPESEINFKLDLQRQGYLDEDGEIIKVVKKK